MIFAGKTAVVLGASARGGSGWTIVEHLRSAGADVAAAARQLKGLHELAAETGARPIQCDISNEAEVQACFAEAKSNFGKIDIVIQAAGLPVAGTILESTRDDLMLAAGTNFFSFFYLLKHGAPLIEDDGSILVLTSLSASRVSPGYALYGAAKAATENLVRYAAVEFADRGIRVNALSPGLIETPMAAGILNDAALREVMYKEIPLGRGVMPNQIAHEALNLVHPGSAITGQSVIVDNGLSLRRPVFPEEIPASSFQDSAKAAGY